MHFLIIILKFSLLSANDWKEITTDETVSFVFQVESRGLLREVCWNLKGQSAFLSSSQVTRILPSLYVGLKMYFHVDPLKKASEISESRTGHGGIAEHFWKVQTSDFEKHQCPEKYNFQENQRFQSSGHLKHNYVTTDKINIFIQFLQPAWKHICLWTVQGDIWQKWSSQFFRRSEIRATNLQLSSG